MGKGQDQVESQVSCSLFGFTFWPGCLVQLQSPLPPLQSPGLCPVQCACSSRLTPQVLQNPSDSTPLQSFQAKAFSILMRKISSDHYLCCHCQFHFFVLFWVMFTAFLTSLVHPFASVYPFAVRKCNSSFCLSICSHVVPLSTSQDICSVSPSPSKQQSSGHLICSLLVSG